MSDDVVLTSKDGGMAVLADGRIRLTGYERVGPPVPGEGPIQMVIPGPEGIVAARYPEGGEPVCWILRPNSETWERYGAQ